MAKKPKAVDALDALINNPERATMLVLWKMRHHFPELSVSITNDDIDAFQKSTDFTKQEPCLKIFRRPALPASPGSPAVGKRRAVPPRAATPAGNSVTVLVVAKGTEVVDKTNGVLVSPGDAIRPVESDEKAHEVAARMADIKKAKEQARQVAQQVMSDAARGEFSSSTIQQAMQMLVTLANA